MNIYQVFLYFRKETDISHELQAGSKEEAIKRTLDYARACGWETKPYRTLVKELA